MTRSVNQETLDSIKQWEGKYLNAYHGAADRPGLLTIGYGHTDSAGPPHVTASMSITEQQAEDILRDDLVPVCAAVERLVTVPLTDNQFGALVSFTFNVGQGALAGSTLLRKLNAGDYDSVPSELMKWTKANGKRVQGLANRRAVEAALWSKGGFVASQFVEPDEQGSLVKDIASNPTIVSTATASAGGIWAAIKHAEGVLEYVIAAVILMAAGTATYYVISRIRDRRL